MQPPAAAAATTRRRTDGRTADRWLTNGRVGCKTPVPTQQTATTQADSCSPLGSQYYLYAYKTRDLSRSLSQRPTARKAVSCRGGIPTTQDRPRPKIRRGRPCPGVLVGIEVTSLPCVVRRRVLVLENFVLKSECECWTKFIILFSSTTPQLGHQKNNTSSKCHI